jgi:asparagine synthase (glutamine-hydrolysing)
MRNIPVSYKIRGMTEKFLLKEAAKPFITDTVYRRQKHPFLSPPATMASDEPLFALIQDKLRGETMANQSFFDQNRIVETLDGLDEMPPEERMGFDPTLMALTSLCIMQEQFGLSL